MNEDERMAKYGSVEDVIYHCAQIRHALWMARALRAGAEANRCSVSKWHAYRVCSNNIKDYFDLKYKKWCWVERKCLEKAKEFE